MDDPQEHPRQGFRPAHPYAASNSSSSVHSRTMAPQSANSSTTHVTEDAPAILSSHPVHRFHHSSCIKPAISPRVASRAAAHPPRQGTPDSARPPALSSYLQEKLQRERRMESERVTFSPAPSRTKTSASVDLGRPACSSPFRPPLEANGTRPQSSTSIEPARKKGLGVKEMEKVVSNLHKQNFDLKLELFHRRERQTALEERLDALESDKGRVEDEKEKLVEELEKRDKAVEEAVAMIVVLEAKLDQLVQERLTVRRVERERYFCPRDYEMGASQATAQPVGRDTSKLESDAKSVTRMPSFLSERSENTENLRNVYLGVKANVHHLPRVVESSPEVGHDRGFDSPTLSILSESSFVSVYGQRGKGMDHGPTVHMDEPLALDGFDGGDWTTDQQAVTAPRRRAASVSKPATASKPLPWSSTAVCFHALSDICYQRGQPRFEHVDGDDYGDGDDDAGDGDGDCDGDDCSTKGDVARPQSREGDPRKSQRKSPAKSSTRKHAHQEQREAFRQVRTDSSGGVHLPGQGLPPTPDTISTSTLHQFETSDEPPLHAGADAPEATSRIPLESTFSAHRLSYAQRPQSAGESITSFGRGHDWVGDHDDFSDSRSVDSNADIWLRESTKPDRTGVRVSPHPFSFLVHAAHGSWEVETVPGRGGALGGGAPLPPRHEFLPEGISASTRVFPAKSSRRSTFHAPTGEPESASPAGNDAALEGLPRRHGRHASEAHENEVDAQLAAQHQQQPHRQPAADQKRHPPVSGHHGARAGLHRFFRRSVGAVVMSPDADSTPPSTSSSAAAENFKGAPLWQLSNCPIEDGGLSGKLPPIFGDRRQGRSNTLDCAGFEHEVSPVAAAEAPTKPHQDDAAPPDPDQPQDSAAMTSSATGGRRKWLPTFGRPAAIKSKAG
ncbi:hypothetical protein DCS_05503 [Drechmeria coniospora]|uniref:Centrosomin N-terminal motif 1 domain-containing protein n=1 Tax=Drechmeria coniospora TaxID=98403 RepID=A0A151GMZ8_DRECN|nr:hypothetical protein DCS_05503 [Drechmeria coniospora]KYK58487.1 hypothetical protein DCS_05503 [Drechmeria coniospora]